MRKLVLFLSIILIASFSYGQSSYYKNEKLKIAQETYKTNQIDIKEIWRNQTKLNDDILYPISGAFVNFLIEYDKEKFLKLTENQTYENAIKIYGENIDDLIDDFIKKLEK